MLIVQLKSFKLFRSSSNTVRLVYQIETIIASNNLSINNCISYNQWNWTCDINSYTIVGPWTCRFTKTRLTRWFLDQGLNDIFAIWFLSFKYESLTQSFRQMSYWDIWCIQHLSVEVVISCTRYLISSYSEWICLGKCSSSIPQHFTIFWIL